MPKNWTFFVGGGQQAVVRWDDESHIFPVVLHWNSKKNELYVPKKVARVQFGLTVFCGLSYCYYFRWKITYPGYVGSLRSQGLMGIGSQTFG